MEGFSDLSARPAAWMAWMSTWYAWALEERERAQVRELYGKLFELRGHLEGRSHEVELVVGSAQLEWDLPGGIDLNHPLLLRRVTLEFDSQRAEITIRDGDAEDELASRVLGHTPVAGHGIALARRLCEELNPHPLDRHGVILFLRGAMNSWFGDISFSGGSVPRPELRFAPVLLLRGAGSQVGTFIERILAELKRGATSPDLLAWLTGDARPPAISEDSGVPLEGGAGHEADDDEDELYFTKPANQEQRKILRLMDHQAAIVVQGPPGTGKTHSIANLIGHFLAKGQTVLVTSETTKALGEVRNQVVPGLRSLCIPLLDSDREGREITRACLHEIDSQAAHRTKAQLQREIAEHGTERGRLLKQRRDLRRKLLDARMSEATPIVVGGVEFTPVMAAKQIVEAGAGGQWIPGPLLDGMGLPLSARELIALYASNGVLSVGDDRALVHPLPDPLTLPPAETLAGLAGRLAELQPDLAMDQPEVWRTRSADPVALDEVARITADALKDLAGAEPWKLAAVEAGIRGEAASLAWQGMVAAGREADRLDGEAQEARFRYHPATSGADDAKALVVAIAIRDHLKSGRSLRRWWGGLADAAWRPYLERWKIDGQVPTTVEHFSAIALTVEQGIAARDFGERFSALVSPHGGPTPTEHGEKAAVVFRQHVEAISRLLSWNLDVWVPLQASLDRLGLSMDILRSGEVPVVGAFAEADRVVSLLQRRVAPLVRGRRAVVLTKAAEGELSASHGQLVRHRAANPESECMVEASGLWLKKNVEGYRRALDRLAAQLSKLEPWRRRNDLLGQLQVVAPAWAEAIWARSGVHGATELPGDPEVAWLVRQLEEAIAVRLKASIQELSQGLAEIEQKLPKVTADLVAAQAWRHQLDRIPSKGGLALKRWEQLVHDAGAGTGSRGKDLLRAAKRLTASAMTAVPVWIMPIWRVFQTVIPSEETRFDVVIIDEASQADLRALPVMYLAKRAIVVGDEEQVTPSAVGERLDDLRKLQADHLSGFPVPEMFDGKQSIYGLAKTHCGLGTTALREHFRCVPDIIAFSNQIAYLRNGRPLLPLRDVRSASVAPAVVAYRVMNAESRNGENLAEARVVTALLGAMIEHPAYRAATFGVIHLVGDQQDRVIETLIRDQLQLDDERIERLKGGGRSTRRLCGKPPDFQGDERTVILLSMVDAPQLDGPLHMRVKPIFNQRFNVAASRARDQLWLVHSLDHAHDLQPGDLRRRLIEHCLDPSVLRQEMEERGGETESPFELEVLQALVSYGYEVLPQYPVGALRIDLLVTDGTRSLAVECDSERFHGPERLLHDMERQRVLERLGHTFHRIRGSAFYRHRDRTLQELRDHIRKRGIQLKDRSSTTPPPVVADGLHRTIIRMAERKMIEWGWVDPPPA